MDPDETLRQMRAAVVDFKDAEDVADGLHSARRLVTAFDAMDQWLTLGGFLPDAWKQR